MSAKSQKEPKPRGLPSLEEARLERRRAIVLGRARLRAMSPRFWLWTGLGFAVFGVVYYKVAQGHLESQKGAVMAKQRAIAQELGTRLLPWRDRIEAWVVEIAGAWPGELAEGGVGLADVTREPGVYLRLRVADAQQAASIRSSATRSLQDGFTACLFTRKGGVDPSKGPKCTSTANCEAGLLCNEWDVCARPTQPYNMRLAYRAMRVLSSEWTDELHRADNDLTVRAHERDLDRTTHDDVPVAIEVLTRARYFTLVLDEDPEGGLPAALARDSGVAETDEQRVQRSSHFVRVGIWDLSKNAPVVRHRTPASARFVPMGDRVVSDPRVVAAQQRQVNSCAAAVSVRQVMEAAKAGSAERPAAVDAGAASTGG